MFVVDYELGDFVGEADGVFAFVAVEWIPAEWALHLFFHL